MAKFNIVVDQKVEIWRQNKMLVRAESLEEAKEKAMKAVENEDFNSKGVTLLTSELNLETERELSKEENYLMAEFETLLKNENLLKEQMNSGEYEVLEVNDNLSHELDEQQL